LHLGENTQKLTTTKHPIKTIATQDQL